MKDHQINMDYDVIDKDKKTLEFIDSETGELERRIIVNPDENVILNKEKLEASRKRKEHEEIKARNRHIAEILGTKKEFGEFFMQKLGAKKNRSKAEVLKNNNPLTLTEEGYFLELLSNFFISSNKPLTKKEKNKRMVIKNKDIEALFGLSKGRVSQLITKFKEKKYLEKRENEKGLFVNSKFFQMKSSAKGEYVAQIYQEKMLEVISSIKRLIPDHNEQMSCIGLISRLSKMFHYDSYHICANPDDLIREKDETVSQALLRNPHAIDYLGTREFMRAISDSGKEVFADTLDFRLVVLMASGVILQASGAGVVYYMHPDLIKRQLSAGDDEYTNTIRSQFASTKAAAEKKLKKAIRDRKEQKDLWSKAKAKKSTKSK